MNATHDAPNLQTRARVIHWAFWYDMMLKVRTLGRERRVRERFLDIAGVAPGQTVLDAGCGTGTMAIAARRRVGDAGAAHAIDASPEMVARARQKAARVQADVSFQPALLEALPFPDASFDVVITSLVLHHFPADLLGRCLSEIRRVLKPDGRLVAFDFAASGHHHGLFGRHDHPHSSFNLYAITPELNAVGLVVRKRGETGFAQIMFIKATPGASEEQRNFPEESGAKGARHGLPSLAMIVAIAAWTISLVAIALFFVGRKWMWFGAGTAATVLAFHIATYHIGLGFGGTSLLGYAVSWFHHDHAAGQ
jgi:ubiquinone/menaquinone biosynthesis C-methylase UbiE